MYTASVLAVIGLVSPTVRAEPSDPPALIKASPRSTWNTPLLMSPAASTAKSPPPCSKRLARSGVEPASPARRPLVGMTAERLLMSLPAFTEMFPPPSAPTPAGS